MEHGLLLIICPKQFYFIFMPKTDIIRFRKLRSQLIQFYVNILVKEHEENIDLLLFIFSSLNYLHENCCLLKRNENFMIVERKIGCVVSCYR